MNSSAVFGAIVRLDFVRGSVFEAIVAGESQVARENARGTEDDDGVGDALFF